MVNVPDFVKRMLRTDGTLKHYSFFSPTNEFPEINNNNLMQESVKFTESLCSQNILKFGTCESSILRFSCIDIGDITGMEFNAMVEVDCTSVPAAEKSGYTFHVITHNGQQLDFYSIYLGNFVVDSAKKDTNTPRKREIVAYSVNNELYPSNNDIWKIKQDFGGAISINFNVFNYVVSAKNHTFKKLDGITYVEIPNTSGPTQGQLGLDAQQLFHKVRVIVRFSSYYSKTDPGTNKYPDANTLGYLGPCPAAAKTNGLNSIQNAISGLESARPVTLSDAEKQAIVRWFQNYIMAANAVSDNEQVPGNRMIPWDNHYTCNGEVRFGASLSIKFESLDGNNPFTPYETTGTFFDSTAISVVKLYSTTVDTNVYPAITIPMKAEQNSSGEYTFESTFGKFSFKQLLESYCEAVGMFVGPSRDGRMQFFSIDVSDAPLYPSDIVYPSDDIYPSGVSTYSVFGANDYISAEYDEKLLRCGGISVTLTYASGTKFTYPTDEFEEDADDAYYKYFIYNITDNVIMDLKNDTYPGGLPVSQLLATDFSKLVDTLKNVKYYPATCKLKGVPYVEKGDTVYVYTQDKTIVLPVLTRTISGIQDLRDTMAS